MSIIATTPDTIPNMNAPSNSTSTQTVLPKLYHCTGYNDPNFNNCSIKQIAEKMGGCSYHVINSSTTPEGRDIVYHDGGSPKLVITTDL